MIYLQHFSYGADEDRFLKILKEGYLKPSFKTNVRSLYQNEGSKWIYTRISTDIVKSDEYFGHFYLDYSLLLNTTFVLHTGWDTEDKIESYQIIDGTKLKKSQLEKLLLQFKSLCIENYKFNRLIAKINKRPMVNSKDYKYTNEILIKDDINLHKYLRKININEDEDKIKKYVKKHYKKVNIL